MKEESVDQLKFAKENETMVYPNSRSEIEVVSHKAIEFSVLGKDHGQRYLQK